MSEQKHTPGPWLIGRGADGYPIVHTAPDSFSPSGQGVAHVCKRTMCQDHEANARLIAAAPDLLAVLKAVEWSEGCPSCGYSKSSGHMDCCPLAAAIAKATVGEGR